MLYFTRPSVTTVPFIAFSIATFDAMPSHVHTSDIVAETGDNVAKNTMLPVSATMSQFLATVSPFLATLSLVWTGLTRYC